MWCEIKLTPSRDYAMKQKSKNRTKLQTLNTAVKDKLAADWK